MPLPPARLAVWPSCGDYQHSTQLWRGAVPVLPATPGGVQGRERLAGVSLGSCARSPHGCTPSERAPPPTTPQAFLAELQQRGDLKRFAPKVASDRPTPARKRQQVAVDAAGVAQDGAGEEGERRTRARHAAAAPRAEPHVVPAVDAPAADAGARCLVSRTPLRATTPNGPLATPSRPRVPCRMTRRAAIHGEHLRACRGGACARGGALVCRGQERTRQHARAVRGATPGAWCRCARRAAPPPPQCVHACLQVQVVGYMALWLRGRDVRRLDHAQVRVLPPSPNLRVHATIANHVGCSSPCRCWQITGWHQTGKHELVREHVVRSLPRMAVAE